MSGDHEATIQLIRARPIAELDPQAPAVIEGLGVSMRQLCDQIAAKLNTMTVEDREALVERYHKEP